jgi:hypothetical protein
MSEGHSSGNGGWAAPDPDEDHDQPLGGWSTPKRTSDLNVVETLPLVSPRQICQDLPSPQPPLHVDSRDAIHGLLGGSRPPSPRRRRAMLLHDEKGPSSTPSGSMTSVAASRSTIVVMRVFFEKPRTTIAGKEF